MRAYTNIEVIVVDNYSKDKTCEIAEKLEAKVYLTVLSDRHRRALLRAGYKIGRIRAQEVHIGEPKSLWEIAKKHYYYGKTIGEYIKRNPERARKQLSNKTNLLKAWERIFQPPRIVYGFCRLSIR